MDSLLLLPLRCSLRSRYCITISVLTSFSDFEGYANTVLRCMLMATGAYEKGHYIIYACNEVIYSKKDAINQIFIYLFIIFCFS